MEHALPASPSTEPMPETGRSYVLLREGLSHLFRVLQQRGFRIVGPTVRDGAIVYDDLASDADLPVGCGDEQDAGRYRLRRRGDTQLFAYAVGPHSWKQYLFPSSVRLWSANRREGEVTFQSAPTESERFAFIGVRACELRAIAIQDRVFMDRYVDPVYAARRSGAFFVAVNCSTPGGTCFCASMHTGPKADSGFDLSLTELLEGGSHRFLVEVGSTAGVEVLADLPYTPATEHDTAAAEAVTLNAAAHMGRSLNTEGLKELLYESYDHPWWDEIAQRCLTCANCTMACPTCFCSSVSDVTDLTGEHAERWRQWDSCFTTDFSYIVGGSIRPSAKSRYRQWMTHKLATWHDQFGSSGCVGCGRCITWCPVGIDITAEAHVLRTLPAAFPSTASSHEH